MKMKRKIVVKKETGAEESKKKLLLNKQSLEMVAFASKNQNRYHTNALHVTKDYVEATDGRILVRLSHPKTADPDGFPVTPGEPFDKIDFMLPAGNIKGIKIPAKPFLPILLNACLSKEGEMISISTTDLEVMQTAKIRPIDGEFPDTEQSIDKSIDKEENNEWKMFTFNSDNLKILANYVSGRNGREQIPITFWIKDPEGPVHFRFKFSDAGQEGRGVLMPMRSEVAVRKGFGFV